VHIEQPNGGSAAGEEQKAHRRFSGAMGIWQIFMLITIWAFTKYDPRLFGVTSGGAKDANGQMDHYARFQDVHVMIFVGFGFLMTFLRKYGFSAVSLNMLVAAFSIQWYIIAGGFIHKLCKPWDDKALESKIEINLELLVLSDFAAAAVLITMGGLLGKVSHQQLLVITFFEIIFFSFNEAINIEQFKTTDMGGSVVLHTFGAYFGLAASWVLTTPEAKEHTDNGSSKSSDLFSMIGTIFLWMYWPSFNSALAPADQAQRCVINTVLSITGSCCAAFITSYYMRGGKFNMVDIQNATLAGGVAIGTACSMAISPGGAIFVGLTAGLLSVVGYSVIAPFLERTIGLHDTCGIHNLHGMPGVLAGVVGAIVTACATDDDYQGNANVAATFPGRFDETGEIRSAGSQAGYQIGYLFSTLAMAIVSGIVTGYIAKFAARGPVTLFDDTDGFEVPDDDIPDWAQVSSPTSHMIRHRGDKVDLKGDAMSLSDYPPTEEAGKEKGAASEAEPERITVVERDCCSE